MFDKQQAGLVQKCQSNDRSAQEKLYKQFYNEMFIICCRYMKSEHLAEEAFNTAFLKVFKSIGDFDANKGSLGGWIRTIMVRTCIDLQRKEIRFTADELPSQLEQDIMEPSVLSKLYAKDLLELVRELPQASQVVFNLSVIDGYSHHEIAEQLDITEATSRWHLSEAKRRLRVRITELDQSLNEQRTAPKYRKS